MWSPPNTERLNRETLHSIQVTTYFHDKIPCRDLNLVLPTELSWLGYHLPFIVHDISNNAAYYT